MEKVDCGRVVESRYVLRVDVERLWHLQELRQQKVTRFEHTAATLIASGELGLRRLTLVLLLLLLFAAERLVHVCSACDQHRLPVILNGYANAHIVITLVRIKIGLNSDKSVEINTSKMFKQKKKKKKKKKKKTKGKSDSN